MTFDRPAGPVSPLTSLARHWVLAAALVVAGVAIGIGLALVRPTIYTAEARVAVGDQGLAAQAVPGFALAAQELAANYARYVDQAQQLSDLNPDLRNEDRSVVAVTASPIPSSSIIRVEVVATTAGRARTAVQEVADGLVRQVDDRPKFSGGVLQQYQALSRQVSAANAAVGAAQAEVSRLAAADTAPEVQTAAQARLVDATSQADALQVQKQALAARYQDLVKNESSAADLSIVRAAAAEGDDRTSRLELYGLAGGAGGAVVALVLASLRDRRRTTRTTSSAAHRESVLQP